MFSTNYRSRRRTPMYKRLVVRSLFNPVMGFSVRLLPCHVQRMYTSRLESCLKQVKRVSAGAKLPSTAALRAFQLVPLEGADAIQHGMCFQKTRYSCITARIHPQLASPHWRLENDARYSALMLCDYEDDCLHIVSRRAYSKSQDYSNWCTTIGIIEKLCVKNTTISIFKRKMLTVKISWRKAGKILSIFSLNLLKCIVFFIYSNNSHTVVYASLETSFSNFWLPAFQKRQCPLSLSHAHHYLSSLV